MSTNIYIMFKNIPVVELQYTGQDFGFSILDKTYAPVQFVNNKADIEKFWQNFGQLRTPILIDNNFEVVIQCIETKYKAILEKINSPENKKKYINLKIADFFYHTSVTDCYWIKDENDQVKWDDINPRTHELKDICKDKELVSKLEYQNEVAKNSLNILNGATPKIWRHDTPNNVTLYKQGGITSVKQFIALMHDDYLDKENKILRKNFKEDYNGKDNIEYE